MNDLVKPGIMRSACLRFAAAPVISTRAADDRTIDYVFSDQSVARDGHTIATAGWELDNYLRNPVFLWAHDGNAPPIGRVVRIGTGDGELAGSVRFATAEEYPFADTIFRLTKGGFINAASVSWLPLDWRYSTDKGRPGGIDFRRQELLEVSAVPVPALASALVTARSAGIDTKPLFDWAEQALDLGGFAVIPRDELEILRREAKMPKGARTAKKTVEVPQDVADEVPAIPAAPAPGATTEATRVGPKLNKRSLGHVSWLAMMLGDLGYLQDLVEYEAAIEEDGSPVPGQLLEALKELGKVLVAMTVEEVGELLAGDDEEDLVTGEIMPMSAGVDLKRSAFHALRRLDEGALAATYAAMFRHLAGDRVVFRVAEAAEVSLSRAGKVLSADNERCLRDALDLHNRACDMIRSVVEKNDADPEQDDDDPDDNERALRIRKAAARRRKHAVAS